MITELSLAASLFNATPDLPKEIDGYWENSQHAVMIRRSNDPLSTGELVWYTTGYTMGEDVWYSGEIYYAPKIGAFCADLYPGNALWPTVMRPAFPLGTVCIDAIDNTLMVGYTVRIKDFEGCLFNFSPSIKRECSGTIDLRKPHDS